MTLGTLRFIVPEGLRDIGDPTLETDDVTKAVMPRDPKAYFENVTKQGVVGALAASGVANTVRHAAKKSAVLPSDKAYAAEQIKLARSLFQRYGDEISAALLLAALPETYATKYGAPILLEHGDLVWNTRRRIRQTALFLVDVLTEDKYDPTGGPSDIVPGTKQLVEACAGLRLFHHVLRTRLNADPALKPYLPRDEKALNQEDLLGTLLTFSITTFRVLDRFGIRWTEEEQVAYLFLWDLVGAYLGICDEAVMSKASLSGKTGRPQTVAEGRSMLGQIQSKQWCPVQEDIRHANGFPWEPLVPGRILTRALLDMLTEAMPPRRKSWPALVMRELAPLPVRERLSLQSGSLLGYAVDRLPGSDTETNRFTVLRAPNRLTGRLLRSMANDVNRNAMMAFLRTDGPPFKIGDLDLGEIVGRPSDPLHIGIRSSKV